MIITRFTRTNTSITYLWNMLLLRNVELRANTLEIISILCDVTKIMSKRIVTLYPHMETIYCVDVAIYSLTPLDSQRIIHCECKTTSCD